MSTRELVLLADDEPLSREFLQEALQAQGLEVVAVGDGDAAIALLHQQQFDIVVTDLKMPGQDGQAVLATSKAQQPERPVILVTAHGTMDVAITAMRAGADDILEKPVGLAELELALTRVRDRRRLLCENRFLRAESTGHEPFVCGPATRAVVELIDRVAPSKATVLIRGESGTGKERIAALVHTRSDRAARPFIKLNCAAVAESLLESELFGHEAGAFTGAARRREGRFELADGGTLFLDEVGEMSAAMQAKLLRVLQEGEFTRVGGNRSIVVDVRVVAATNRDLERDVAAGRFRDDLFYRLDVVPIFLTPLRQRPEEIVPLARSFLRPGITLTADAEAALQQWSWPGNVRELQNVIQRLCLLAPGRLVDAAAVHAWLQPGRPDALPTVVLQPATDPYEALAGRPLADIEAELVRRTLRRCQGNRTRTAELLGIGVRTLFNKLKDDTLVEAPRA
ncbi:MAG: sigma-54-dependent Fis family transcriptional regulator [Planctomycetes bacterium]|nr:sigma-54-dependent Fis family transcriptional regulator [Planctomycetota bacterium]